MKKIYFLSFLIVVTFIFVNAQYKLSSGSNSFVIGDKHDFVFMTNTTEGANGKNVTWDYTGLQKTDKVLTTNMYASSVSDKSVLIPQANLVLEEAGNLFFFKVTKEGMAQVGTAGGCSVIRYDKPLVKLSFPFRYADKVIGDYNGVVINQDKSESKISGTYEVVADAYGTLLLPDNVTIKNALRVKQTYTFNNSDQKEITYRWYAQGVRYPILVVIKFESAQKSYISQTALYTHAGNTLDLSDETIANETSKFAIAQIEVFPNPFKGQFTVRYKLEKAGSVKIDLIDADGKIIRNCVNQNMEAGYNSHIILMDKNMVGSYFIRFTADENVVIKKVIQN
jgi:hypothetical protein